ncbi:MAG: hypothetical protein H7196_02060 [candidate division SR1 bacterium]|nr:hypothetical protein [candidate division SR1 bacterium]
MLKPGFTFSILIIVLKNNSIQDWVSGIKYNENVKFKLTIRTFLKHICASLVFIFTGVVAMNYSSVNFRIELIVGIQALLFIVIDTVIVMRSNTYTSVFNIITEVKK